MAKYKYKARNAFGKVQRGNGDFESEAELKSFCKSKRLILLDFQKEKASSGLLSGVSSLSRLAKVTTKDIIVFTKQFAVMLRSGVVLVQALDILSKQQRIDSFGEQISHIRQTVENGSTFSAALMEFPQHFDELYVSMVQAGEASGNLDVIMFKLVDYIEKKEKIRNQVISAMTFPTFVVVIAITVVTIMLVFVVPTFKEQFESQGKELPALTTMVIQASNLFVANWYVLIMAAFLSVMAVNYWRKTPSGGKKFDEFSLKAPVFGPLFLKISIGRFCSTLAIMLTSGVNLLEALTICSAAAGNKHIEDYILKVRTSVENGGRLSDSLEAGGMFPNMVISMVGVGEASGSMDEMLTKVSEFYEDEVDLAMKAMVASIEPIAFVVIGGILGVVLIAMYLPIFDIASVVG